MADTIQTELGAGVVGELLDLGWVGLVWFGLVWFGFLRQFSLRQPCWPPAFQVLGLEVVPNHTHWLSSFRFYYGPGLYLCVN